MEAMLLYLLKANVVLLLFAAAYYGLLRQLTFFKLNRAYLALALLFAAAYPVLPVPGLLPAVALPAQVPTVWVAATAAVVARPTAAGPGWRAIALGLYAAGALLLLVRLLVQLLALAQLRQQSGRARSAAGVPYRQLPAPGNPFSFGRTIYLHASQHSAAELAVVLAHEQAHVRQAHTLDVLLTHLGTAVFWVNPAAWLLRRATLDNLEYLADAATLRTGLDHRTYQYCLLKLSTQQPAGPALALRFTFFTLKNRIAMMNRPLSPTGQLARYLLAGPLLAVAALGYAAAHTHRAGAAPALSTTLAPVSATVAAARAQPGPVEPLPSTRQLVASKSATSHLASSRPARPVQGVPTPLYYIDGKLTTEVTIKDLNPDSIASISVLKGEEARQLAGEPGAARGVVIITTKANENSRPVQKLDRKVARIAALPKTASALIAPRGEGMPATAHYYLNGQLSTLDAVNQLDPQTIANIDVVGNPTPQAQPNATTSPQPTTIYVTTKAPAAAPAVPSPAPKTGQDSEYTARPLGTNALVPAALAYITSHYPSSRLNEVTELTQKATGATKYRVQLITGRRPFYIYLTPQGEFLSE